MVRYRLALVWLSLILGSATAFAELSTSVKMTLLESATRESEYDWSAAALGTGRITFKNQEDENIRAQLSIDAYAGETAYLDIARAFIKVRFPWFRTTVGKSALSWGEGFYYNAGDVIFGPVGSTRDITADQLRDDAAWLTAVYLPLGPFSFLEAVVLVPGLDITGDGSNLPNVTDTAAGMRVQAKIGATQTEAGYLYRGEDKSHNPYIGLQGNLYLDWYASATTATPLWELAPDKLWDAFTVSWGLFHIARLPGGTSLQLRLEGLVRPSGDWGERPWNDPQQADYGLMLYPEITWNASESVALSFRNFVSPLDSSAMLTAGVTWNVYQGLKVLAFAVAQAGETSDVYGWDRLGGVAFTTGLQYIY